MKYNDILKTFALAWVASMSLPAFAASEDLAVAAQKPKKIFLVVLENTDAEDALKQPFQGRLAREGAYLSNIAAVARPSQPNYIALVSGDTHGVDTNRAVTVDARSLADQIEEKGLRWKTYAENFPGNCSLTEKSGQYVRKHNPFISFSNITSSRSRCANIVNADQLKKDIEEGTLPEFSLFIPNNSNNGHDTNPAYSDRWLEKTFGPLIKDPRFMDGMLFIVTYDEASKFNRSNLIYTTFYGDSVVPGKVVDKKYTLYSLLRTIQDNFGLGTLGLNDERAQSITGLWK